MVVPFADLSRGVRDERLAIQEAITRVLDSGRYIGGEEVDQFEREWAASCGAARCVAVASGTDAIKIALRSLAEPGSGVVTVANSAPATVTAIIEAGMNPVFCDIAASGPDAGLMDMADAERVIRETHPRPRVLLPVHLYGRMADMMTANIITQRHGMVLIEDACQAHGSMRDGIHAGFLSAAMAASFYPTKNLGALGDAGAITIPAQYDEQRMRQLGNYGLRNRSELAEYGYNSRMDPIQASILRTRIPRLVAYNAHRESICAIYRSALGPNIICGGNHHIVAIRTSKRAELIRHLSKHGIVTHVHYETPAHDLMKDSLPNTEAWCREVLSLPLSNYIRREEAEYVAEKVHSFS